MARRKSPTSCCKAWLACTRRGERNVVLLHQLCHSPLPWTPSDLVRILGCHQLEADALVDWATRGAWAFAVGNGSYRGRLNNK